MIKTDVLVIGSGIAGATAAYWLAKGGLFVTIVTRSQDPADSNTKQAQGGIVIFGENDSPDLLAKDIMEAGDGLCNPKAVQLLVEKGPPLVHEFLIGELKVDFSKDAYGNLDLTKEAAHSTRRIIHANDATGKAIEERLIEALLKISNVSFLTNHTAIDIITRPHHSTDLLAIYDSVSAHGAYVLDNNTRTVKTILAGKTIIATGGLGQIYLHTTNAEGIRGDGIAMAYRAGATIINAEYIQFHPTAFYSKFNERFLITESVRGEGAKLMNRRGHYFMHNYDPELADLAPRDIVARAIYEEMLKENSEFVLLDLSPLVKKNIDIPKRFPTLHENCLKYGIDPTKSPIPVVPAAHYFCGGIKVDIFGRTEIKNLYAIGEASCTGLHGANRLASTSLLEGLVWGYQAASDILSDEVKIPEFLPKEIPPWEDKGLDEEVDPALLIQDWTAIKSTMWNYAGIVRTTSRLERALADMEYLEHRIDRFYRRTKLTDNLIGLRNAIQVALIVIRSALRNRVSRGCHFRKF